MQGWVNISKSIYKKQKQLYLAEGELEENYLAFFWNITQLF